MDEVNIPTHRCTEKDRLEKLETKVESIDKRLYVFEQMASDVKKMTKVAVWVLAVVLGSTGINVLKLLNPQAIDNATKIVEKIESE